MDESHISILNLPDRGLSYGVHAPLSSRSSFMVYGTYRSQKSYNLDNIQYLHEITPVSALYNDYVRKLVNESRSRFLSLNAKIAKFQDEVRRSEIARVSQQYRSVILACVEELHIATQSSEDEDLLDLLQMFSDIELLWNLIHTLILDAPSGTRVLYKLLDWIKWHFVFAQKKREEIIQFAEPTSHPDYWDAIIQLLFQGNIANARSLLSLHRKCKRDDFVSLDELLEKMPFYGANCNVSLNEFRIRWKLWQEECKARLERGEFSSEQNLEIICRVLCGDLEILSEKSYLCKNWYHLMISVLLYTNPCINVSDLGDIARSYYNNVVTNGDSISNLVDSVILAAMELDIKNVINLICSFNDSWWFATHLMDLLSHGNFIENTKKSDTQNYRKFLLKNYAETLMSHPSLWQVGIDYLDECKASCEIYLERVPLKSDAQARKIIYIAKKKNMENLVKTVANVMTSRAISGGKLGNALTWVMHSKDTRYADEIADKWLNGYADKRSTEGFEIFRNMGTCMLVSDKLTFVGKYCEFHKLYEDKDLKNAASLLISLIASGLAPPNFQMILLLDALPLLEAAELIFTRKDTYQLMECLEEASKFSKLETISDTTEQENIIRLALVRNLARCFLIETDDSEEEEEMLH